MLASPWESYSRFGAAGLCTDVTALRNVDRSSEVTYCPQPSFPTSGVVSRPRKTAVSSPENWTSVIRCGQIVLSTANLTDITFDAVQTGEGASGRSLNLTPFTSFRVQPVSAL